MRVIEFRAVSQLDGNWVYGSLIKYDYEKPNMEDLSKPHIQSSYDICRKENDWCFSYKNVPVFEETIGQYTGLTDKNGTKIFEGDIVQSITEDTHEKRFAVIKFGKYKDDNFEDSAMGFYFECGGYQFSMFNGEAQGYDFPSFVEVVGNIHDNPELLEEV